MGTAQWGHRPNDETFEWVPNRNLYVFNNLFYNPAPARTQGHHLAVNGPVEPPPEARNLPRPSTTDDNLIIRGNLIWNGGAEIELLGSTNGSHPGCTPESPTCNPTRLRAENSVNAFEPQLENPEVGDFQPILGSNLSRAQAYPIPDFAWDRFTPDVPPGRSDNRVPCNRAGAARTGAGRPGAY
jgi:hypothetical protein